MDNTARDSSVAQLAVDTIRAAGIDTLFCLPGVQNDEFFDALVDARDIRPIVARHEQGAAYMALGASQATGRPAACCVVPGPGLLNAASGLTSAYWAGGRVLALVGAIPHPLKGKGVGVLHELPDQTAVLEQVTKHAAYISSGEEAVAVAQGVLESLLANEGRPVSLEVPVNVWGQFIDGVLEAPVRSTPTIDPVALERAANAIAGAERPVIIVGSGAYEAGDQVRALAELLQAPVFTRRQGHGVIDSRHPLWVPLPVGRDLWGEADVAIGIGTRLEFPILHWGTDDGLQIVQINIDEAELDRHDLGTIGVHGDATTALDGLLEALVGHEPSTADRPTDLAKRRSAFAAEIAHLEPQLSHLAAIRQALPDDGIIVEDVTQLTFAAHFAFEFRHPRTMLTSGAAGTLGAAVAQAIGAQVAVPDRRVLAIVGDGGFLFTATELATAVKYNVPVTVLVHDNSAYGNVKRIQQERCGPDRTIASDLVNPDLLAFGESFGVHSQRAESADELREALERAFAHDGPSLVVVPMGEVPSPWPWIVMAKNRGADS